MNRQIHQKHWGSGGMEIGTREESLADFIDWLRMVEKKMSKVVDKESGVYGVAWAQGRRELVREMLPRLEGIEGRIR